MLSGLRALVVTDVSSVRDVIGSLLALEGAAVLEACTGDEALEIARTQQFDVALTDLRLRDSSGEAVIAYIRAASGGRTRIAVLSGVSERELARALEIGADRIFAKPIDWDALVQYLEGQEVAAA